MTSPPRSDPSGLFDSWRAVIAKAPRCPDNPELTVRQSRFIDELLLDKDGVATTAAIRAGAPERSAKQWASITLQKPHIQAELARRRAARRERVEIEQDDVLRELAMVAFGDLRSVMSWGPDGVVLKDSGEIEDAAARALAEVAETKSENGGSMKVRRHDKMKALELLGRHLGMFAEKHQISGDPSNPLLNKIVVEIVDAQDSDG